MAGGRVPGGRGLAHLEATSGLHAAAAESVPDDVLAKELQEAFEGLLAGARGAAAWSRLYRLPLATPRFDVGRYREIAASSASRPTSGAPAAGCILPATT